MPIKLYKVRKKLLLKFELLQVVKSSDIGNDSTVENDICEEETSTDAENDENNETTVDIHTHIMNHVGEDPCNDVRDSG